MVWSEIVWFQIINLMVWVGSGVGQSVIQFSTKHIFNFCIYNDVTFLDFFQHLKSHNARYTKNNKYTFGHPVNITMKMCFIKN